MRLDKWLWCVRAFRTRTRATESCAAGRVSRDEVPLKPATEVRVGDSFRIASPDGVRILKAIELPPTRVAAPRLPEFIADLSPPPPPRPASDISPVGFRPRGAGRPTKRDRRKLDALKTDWHDT